MAWSGIHEGFAAQNHNHTQGGRTPAERELSPYTVQKGFVRLRRSASAFAGVATTLGGTLGS